MRCKFAIRLKRVHLRTGTVLVLLLFSSSLFAEQKTGAQFLRVGIGSRENSMGKAGAAVSNDLNALFWNPAGLSHIKNVEVGLTHAEWFLDTRYDTFGVAKKYGKGTWAVSGTRLGYGKLEGRTENRIKTNDFESSDLSIQSAYGTSLNNRIRLGAGIKYIRAEISDEKAHAAAFDAGTQIDLFNNTETTLGLSMRNLGTEMKFIDQSDPLPFTVAVGLGQPLLTRFLLSAEWQYEPYDDLHSVVLGGEAAVIKNLFLRGGYLTPLSSNQINDSQDALGLDGLSAGAGFILFGFSFDYAFTPIGTLGETHRFSITFKK